MSDTFVVIEEPAPNVVIVEQTVNGVVVTETATPANVVEVTPPPSTVIVEGADPNPNVVVIAPASVSAGVASFDGRTATVTFELADAERIFTADGQLLVGSGSGTGVLLDLGSSGQVLTVSGSTAAWEDPTGGGGSFPDYTGGGSPEGVQVGTVGQWYENTAGSSVGLYVKGSGSGDTGWISVAGTDYTVPGITVESDALYLMSTIGEGVVISDTTGIGGTGNSLVYYGNGSDGNQTLGLQLGSSSQYAWTFDADGTTWFPGSLGVGNFSGDAATIYAYNGDPTGNISPREGGDICIDFGTPAIWQSTSNSDTSWVQVGTGGGGGGVTDFNTRTGSVTFELADAETIFTAAGDLLYGTGSGTGAILSAATDGYVLTLAGGLPTWLAIGGGPGAFPTYTGSGSPEGVVSGSVGDTYQDSTGAIYYMGVGGGNTGWRAGVGGTYGIWDPPITAGIGFNGTGTADQALLIVGTPNNSVVITDEFGAAGSFSGIYLIGGAADYEQSVNFTLGGPSPAYEWEFLPSGQTVFPSYLSVNNQGATFNLLSYAGDPTGNVSAAEEGDICVDTSTPAIWQATGSGDSSWVEVGSGGGGGSFPDFTGSGTPVGALGGTYGQWYEDTSGSTTGLYTRTQDVNESSYLYADVNVSFPLTIATGVNDTFVFTPIATSTPETFTIAAGTYSSQPELMAAVGAAIGSGSSEAWSTLVDTEFSGQNAFVTAGTAITSPVTVVTGVNDTFYYTPILTGVPELFTVSAGTYSNVYTVAAAMDEATGLSSENFDTIAFGGDFGANFLRFNMRYPGTFTNGDTLTSGPTDILSSIGFTSPATFSGGVDGPMIFYLNTGGTSTNGDTITFGSSDAAADLGFTGNPDTFAHGYGDYENGWMQIGGYAPSGKAQYGLSAPQYNYGNLQLLSQYESLLLSDVGAVGHSNNGIYWFAGATDGTQILEVVTGSGGQFITQFDQAGNAFFPGPINVDYYVDGGSATIYSYPGDPNSHIAGNPGDICIDPSSPALWQQVGGTWYELGGSGGSFPNLTGSGSPVGTVSGTTGEWYEDTSHSTSGLFVRDTGASGYASVTADSAPTVPLAVVATVNDTFVYTPVATGIPETFTLIPGTYLTFNDVLGAMQNATGSVSGELFSTLVDASDTSGQDAFVTAITPPSFPYTVTTGVNDTFIYTPISTGTPETFTVAAGTYTIEDDLAAAFMAATGTMSDLFSDYMDGYEDNPGVGGVGWFSIFAADDANGDTLTTGTTDILAGIGFTSPATFVGGTPTLIQLYALTPGAAHNGDLVDVGPTDVLNSLGFTSTPASFRGGFGEPDDNWMQVGGRSLTPTWGMSGVDGNLNLLSYGETVTISDTNAMSGSGSGLYWYGDGGDYQQELVAFVSGPGPVFPEAGFSFGTYEEVAHNFFSAPPAYDHITAIGSPYTMTGNDAIIFTDNAVTLPSPVFSYGVQYYIKDSGSGTATILPFGAEEIDGGGSVALGPREAVLLYTDGHNWFSLSNTSPKTKTWNVSHTWAIQGAVSNGTSTPWFFAPVLATGQTMTVVEAIYSMSGGTCTVEVEQAAFGPTPSFSAVAGLGALSASTTPTNTAATGSPAIASRDLFMINISSAASTPTNLTVTLVFSVTA